MHELLSVDEMGRADALTIKRGKPGIELMENAGEAVFRVVQHVLAQTGGGKVLVACGLGNNGGDGSVVARMLAAHGYQVKLAFAGNTEKISGDAAIALERWGGQTANLADVDPSGFALIVDALLGAGLDRDVKGAIGEFIHKINESGKPVVAVDLPSGIDGNAGAVMGVAVRAVHTVTFFRKKPGHLCFPGKSHCGEVSVADIGIGSEVLDEIKPQFSENQPGLWYWQLPKYRSDGHKYSRGHALIVSGGQSRTGAARLAAEAALRSGAGLVTLASPPEALATNADHLTAVMLLRMEGSDGLKDILRDKRLSAIGMGPAMGLGQTAREKVVIALGSGRNVVLDADALTCFEDQPDQLFEMISAASGDVVLTPHQGEFVRLFGKKDRQAKLQVAINASK
ncbi:MAG: NAD(P)H-hydrate epimerase, partial [Rhizobiaceae bacterium]